MRMDRMACSMNILRRKVWLLWSIQIAHACLQSCLLLNSARFTIGWLWWIRACPMLYGALLVHNYVSVLLRLEFSWVWQTAQGHSWPLYMFKGNTYNMKSRSRGQNAGIMGDCWKENSMCRDQFNAESSHLNNNKNIPDSGVCFLAHWYDCFCFPKMDHLLTIMSFQTNMAFLC